MSTAIQPNQESTARYDSLTWEQKLAILKYIGIVDIHMSKPGNWSAEARTFRIRSSQSDFGYRPKGVGDSPEAAVLDLWRACVDELGDNYLFYDDGIPRFVRYHGVYTRYH